MSKTANPKCNLKTNITSKNDITKNILKATKFYMPFVGDYA
jgi:hypothetical protein